MRILVDTTTFDVLYCSRTKGMGSFAGDGSTKMRNITINIDGMDFWTLVGLINSLSEVEGNDRALDEINDYIATNRKKYEKVAIDAGDTDAIELMNDVFGMKFADWLVENDSPTHWDVVERAAKVYSSNGMSGKCKGLCEALSCMSDCALEDVRRFVEDYSKEWYRNGVRIDE